MQVDPGLAQHLWNLETRLLQPSVRQSADEVSTLLADEFIEFGSSGRIFTKQAIIDALHNESPTTRTVSDFKATGLSQDIILVTYRVTRKETNGEPPTHSLRSSIWKLIDGGWRMVFHQGTITQD